MPNALQRALDDLASSLVRSIVDRIQESSLAEVLREGSPASRGREGSPDAQTPAAPRDGRATTSETGGDITAIVRHLRAHPGSTGEAARKALGLRKNRWSTCVYRALRDGQIRKAGERRSTRYWAASSAE